MRKSNKFPVSVQTNVAEAGLSFKEKFPLADDVLIDELVAQDKGEIPVESFFQNPQKTRFTISPNGQYLAWLAPYEQRLNLHVQNRATGEVRRITQRTDRDIPNYIWADDEHLVYLQDNGGDENHHLYLARRDGTDERDLTPFDGVKAEIIDDLADIPNQLIVGLNKRNPQLVEPYRLDVSTGELTLLADNEDLFNPITTWITDHEGRIRAAVKMTGGVNSSLLFRNTEQEPWQTVLTTNFRESMQPLFFTFDNSQLYCASNLRRDKTAIVRFDPVGATELSVIYENNNYDVENLHYSHKRKLLTSISYTSWKREVIFLDKVIEFVYHRLYKALPGYEVVIVDTNKEEELFIARAYSDRSMGAFYLYDSRNDELTKLADVNPNLQEDHMAEMRPISYTSRDGLTIHGYLTLPAKSNGKNLPLVVNPHGGPWVRDAWGFNPEVQLLASRGYAVFQMNYRGSTGFGRAFWEASFKQWGRAMQNDITDGVQWLINQGIADAKRVAIYGGSYGGYATLAGVTFTPDLYCCAIDYVGVSNLFTFLSAFPPYWKPYLEMVYDMVGNPETDKADMEAASPVYHVSRIKAPLFIIQGAKDPRVNIHESDQMVKALREHGVTVPYLVKENEGHGFHNQENRFLVYKAMCGFLSRYLG